MTLVKGGVTHMVGMSWLAEIFGHFAGWLTAT